MIAVLIVARFAVLAVPEVADHVVRRDRPPHHHPGRRRRAQRPGHADLPGQRRDLLAQRPARAHPRLRHPGRGVGRRARPAGAARRPARRGRAARRLQAGRGRTRSAGAARAGDVNASSTCRDEPPADEPAPHVNVGEVEERLLGGPRRHTRDEVAASAGVPAEYVPPAVAGDGLRRRRRRRRGLHRRRPGRARPAARASCATACSTSELARQRHPGRRPQRRPAGRVAGRRARRAPRRARPRAHRDEARPRRPSSCRPTTSTTSSRCWSTPGGASSRPSRGRVLVGRRTSDPTAGLLLGRVRRPGLLHPAVAAAGGARAGRPGRPLRAAGPPT